VKISAPKQRQARIEMLPLIDIVFLLLVFFIYAMLSMAVHRGLSVELPVSATAELDKERILSVTVKYRAGGAEYFVDEEPVALSALAAFLKKRAAVALSASARQPGVLLFADRRIDYQQLFMVLDQINQAGLSRISLQADVEQ
jgi:biopolymer transport protein ExbD